MEAVLDLGLSTLQLEQINACRMSVQVTTLAEIVDHTGKLLLSNVLLQPRKTIPLGLNTISHSKLQWPQIHNPSQSCWKFWTKTICTIFTGSTNGTRLQQPLGPWTAQYDTVRHWHWRLAHTGWLLHQANDGDRPRAAIPTGQQRTQLLFSLTVPTNQEFHGPPVTPFDQHQRCVRLPITPLPNAPSMDLEYISHRSLIAQFHTALTTWQKPLFGLIQKLQPTHSTLKYNEKKGTILIISNALVQKNKQSGFAWMIAHEHTPLWKGTGLAPGTADDIYSGRAEAFGLIAGLTFLHYYISCYGANRFQEADLNCFCDNLGVITNVETMMTSTSI